MIRNLGAASRTQVAGQANLDRYSPRLQFLDQSGIRPRSDPIPTPPRSQIQRAPARPRPRFPARVGGDPPPLACCIQIPSPKKSRRSFLPPPADSDTNNI